MARAAQQLRSVSGREVARIDLHPCLWNARGVPPACERIQAQTSHVGGSEPPSRGALRFAVPGDTDFGRLAERAPQLQHLNASGSPLRRGIVRGHRQLERQGRVAAVPARDASGDEIAHLESFIAAHSLMKSGARFHS